MYIQLIKPKKPATPLSPPAVDNKTAQGLHNNPNLGSSLLLVLSGCIIILLCLITFFLAWQNRVLSDQLSQILTQPNPHQIPRRVNPTLNPTAGWQIYTNQDLGYQIKFPPTLNLDASNPQSILIGEMPQLIYISAITDPTQRNDVYNFFPEEHQRLISLDIGQSANSRFFPATRIEDITIDGQSAKKFIDNTKTIVDNPHQRFIVNVDNKTYIIGAYLNNMLTESLFSQILSTFRFLVDITPTPASPICGGIAAIPCPEGFTCKLDGLYPDASGTCVQN
jgi:hypothetical protein